ncbi:hypothetical protein J6590_107790 [Homalodisca vitripennis]|nr:hypothetical protein J6590_107790 [Homalodisca vitripennis]
MSALTEVWEQLGCQVGPFQQGREGEGNYSNRVAKGFRYRSKHLQKSGDYSAVKLDRFSKVEKEKGTIPTGWPRGLDTDKSGNNSAVKLDRFSKVEKEKGTIPTGWPRGLDTDKSGNNSAVKLDRFSKVEKEKGTIPTGWPRGLDTEVSTKVKKEKGTNPTGWPWGLDTGQHLQKPGDYSAVKLDRFSKVEKEKGTNPTGWPRGLDTEVSTYRSLGTIRLSSWTVSVR